MKRLAGLVIPLWLAVLGTFTAVALAKDPFSPVPRPPWQIDPDALRGNITVRCPFARGTQLRQCCENNWVDNNSFVSPGEWGHCCSYLYGAAGVDPDPFKLACCMADDDFNLTADDWKACNPVTSKSGVVGRI